MKNTANAHNLTKMQSYDTLTELHAQRLLALMKVTDAHRKDLVKYEKARLIMSEETNSNDRKRSFMQELSPRSSSTMSTTSSSANQELSSAEESSICGRNSFRSPNIAGEETTRMPYPTKKGRGYHFFISKAAEQEETGLPCQKKENFPRQEDIKTKKRCHQS